ncbi:skin secretory protein xP2-like [Melopsittacus undulatus]|uniref:skin secretory protein xP2-like n=1 Tax=Melopsittacus undulatus TaxID=13146 RepID=UPI00146B0AF2|nr:skin secretory protein xP2-like [Melopsittacus undulatus]
MHLSRDAGDQRQPPGQSSNDRGVCGARTAGLGGPREDCDHCEEVGGDPRTSRSLPGGPTLPATSALAAAPKGGSAHSGGPAAPPPGHGQRRPRLAPLQPSRGTARAEAARPRLHRRSPGGGSSAQRRGAGGGREEQAAPQHPRPPAPSRGQRRQRGPSAGRPPSRTASAPFRAPRPPPSREERPAATILPGSVPVPPAVLRGSPCPAQDPAAAPPPPPPPRLPALRPP